MEAIIEEMDYLQALLKKSTNMLNIEKDIYQGYLWYSDSNTPTVIDGEFSLQLSDTQIPYVVEGQLFNITKRESMSIKFVDGRYITAVYKVLDDDFNSVDVDLCEYLPHRMPNISGLLFLKYWTPVTDELCCGMPTLVPSKKVFVGFK